jgi:hypothetical protein
MIRKFFGFNLPTLPTEKGRGESEDQLMPEDDHHHRVKCEGVRIFAS